MAFVCMCDCRECVDAPWHRAHPGHPPVKPAKDKKKPKK